MTQHRESLVHHSFQSSYGTSHSPDFLLKFFGSPNVTPHQSSPTVQQPQEVLNIGSQRKGFSDQMSSKSSKIKITMQVRFLRSCRTGYVTAILKEYGFEGASTLFHASGGFHHELELIASKVSTELRERCKWDRKGCHTGCILAKVQPALMEKQPVSHAKTLINLKIPEKKKSDFWPFSSVLWLLWR